LLGPIFWLLTRLARASAESYPDRDDVRACLLAHVSALAAHSAVLFEVRLVAGAPAIEHRGAAVPR
jgi:hypothetical protein